MVDLSTTSFYASVFHKNLVFQVVDEGLVRRLFSRGCQLGSQDIAPAAFQLRHIALHLLVVLLLCLPHRSDYRAGYVRIDFLAVGDHRVALLEVATRTFTVDDFCLR